MTSCWSPAPYRVLVTGSRMWRHPADVDTMLDGVLRNHPDLVIIHGAARGVDTMADTWARTHRVPTEQYPAQWSDYGKAAGSRRNLDMVRRGADLCLGFIRNRSRGASHCVACALAAEILTIVIRDDADLELEVST